MLELTKVQTRILEAFFEVRQKNQDPTQGISSYAIRNQGIPGRTFDINKNALLYNQLIRIIHEEKTGKQNRFYYELTPIGFFSLIKALSKDNSAVLEKYVKFIPHLGERWHTYNQSLKPYQFLLPRLLKRALDEIDISVHYRLHTKDHKFRPRIEEITKLVFEDRGLEIKQSELYYPAKEEERGIHHKTFFKKKEKLWKKFFSKESIKISNHMVDKLIFLFYFNAIKLEHDDRFGFHIFNDFHVDEFEKIKMEIPKEHEEIDDFESIKNEYKTKWDNYDKFWSTKRLKFASKIMKDVFEKDELLYIFGDGFDPLHSVFYKRPTTFVEIDKVFTKKMIEKGIEYGIIKLKKTKDSKSESES